MEWTGESMTLPRMHARRLVIIAATHDPSLIGLADSVLVLEDGQITAG
jgi:ABC-type protease/lipase transport system fused ATPase/permease subunit